MWPFNFTNSSSTQKSSAYTDTVIQTAMVSEKEDFWLGVQGFCSGVQNSEVEDCSLKTVIKGANQMTTEFGQKVGLKFGKIKRMRSIFIPSVGLKEWVKEEKKWMWGLVAAERRTQQWVITTETHDESSTRIKIRKGKTGLLLILKHILVRTLIQ